MEEINNKENFNKTKEIFERLEYCLNLLKKEENKLYKDITDTIDREKMKKIIDRIDKTN